MIYTIMKQNHFFIPYAGNKRTEVEELYKSIEHKINDIKTIIEPFCGSCAFSYYIWTKHPELPIKYILNDNNKFIIELMKISKNENEFNKLSNSLIKLHEETDSKEKYNAIFKKSNDDLISYIYVNKIYSIRAGLYPTNKVFKPECWDNFKNAKIVEFLRNTDVELSNIDALEVYEKYKNDKKSLIFLDPPYLSCENRWYKSPTVNIYEYLHENDIDKQKAMIVLCLENIWIIKLLFNKKKSITYDKLYQTSKKKTEHIIILNKNV